MIYKSDLLSDIESYLKKNDQKEPFIREKNGIWLPQNKSVRTSVWWKLEQGYKTDLSNSTAHLLGHLSSEPQAVLGLHRLHTSSAKPAVSPHFLSSSSMIDFPFLWQDSSLRSKNKHPVMGEAGVEPKRRSPNKMHQRSSSTCAGVYTELTVNWKEMHDKVSKFSEWPNGERERERCERLA